MSDFVRLHKSASMDSNENRSQTHNGEDSDEVAVPDYVCCVVTEGVWVWFAAIVLFAILMFIATLKVSYK